MAAKGFSFKNAGRDPQGVSDKEELIGGKLSM
jgi:hypothetical protein